MIKLPSRGDAMSVYRVIDIIGTSSTSWEDAATEAIRTAAQSIRDLRCAVGCRPRPCRGCTGSGGPRQPRPAGPARRVLWAVTGRNAGPGGGAASGELGPVRAGRIGAG